MGDPRVVAGQLRIAGNPGTWNRSSAESPPLDEEDVSFLCRSCTIGIDVASTSGGEISTPMITRGEHLMTLHVVSDRYIHRKGVGYITISVYESVSPRTLSDGLPSPVKRWCTGACAHAAAVTPSVAESVSGFWTQ